MRSMKPFGILDNFSILYHRKCLIIRSSMTRYWASYFPLSSKPALPVIPSSAATIRPLRLQTTLRRTKTIMTSLGRNGPEYMKILLEFLTKLKCKLWRVIWEIEYRWTYLRAMQVWPHNVNWQAGQSGTHFAKLSNHATGVIAQFTCWGQPKTRNAQ